MLLRELPYQYDVAGPVLDDTKQTEDDHNDVEEVDDDRSPLEAQEVKHLPLGCSDLPERSNRSLFTQSFTAFFCSLRPAAFG